MFVRPFNYLQARSVEEASALLAEHGDAKLLAGGQSLMPLIQLGLAQVDAVIDICSIPGLEAVTLEDGDGERPALQLGALTRHRSLERDGTVRESQPLLTEAVRHVGNPRVRNLGTLGGSLAHNDPAAELPLVMQVLDAECTVSSGRGTRRIAADSFFVSYFTTALADDELLVSVRVPTLLPDWGWGFHELAVRAGDFAIVAAAAVARCENGSISSLRAGLAGVADRAVRCRSFEAAAQGSPLDGLDDGLRPDGGLARALAEDISRLSPSGRPIEDATASGEYRLHLARVLMARAVQDACSRSRQRAPDPDA